ncbi:hypothetical protein [Siphonobacter sp.]|uniref:hypothetical protein n=1 Tax=Siphonobacter sp. TaxID=1869184 RepID=UPI003B3BCCD6
MKLNGLYQDGQVIASGSFGTVYITPFEDGVVAVALVGGGLKYLAKERLLKLVNADKTLTFDQTFEVLDLEALYTEQELNNRFSIQGGWSLNTGAADGTYTAFTKGFSGQYIRTPEMLADAVQQNLFTSVVAAAAELKIRQQKPVNPLRQFWRDATGW